VIVVDASVLVGALMGEEAAADRQAGEDLAAPHLIDIEVGHVVRRFVAAGRITPERGLEAIHDLSRVEIERYEHAGLLLLRAWDLRDNLSFYDATYVALAEALRVPLVTLDARLAGAPGVMATVEVVRGVPRS
jgi:predicted nucleic acid-binding protein